MVCSGWQPRLRLLCDTEWAHCYVDGHRMQVEAMQQMSGAQRKLRPGTSRLLQRWVDDMQRSLVRACWQLWRAETAHCRKSKQEEEHESILAETTSR